MPSSPAGSGKALAKPEALPAASRAARCERPTRVCQARRERQVGLKQCQPLRAFTSNLGSTARARFSDYQATETTELRSRSAVVPDAARVHVRRSRGRCRCQWGRRPPAAGPARPGRRARGRPGGAPHDTYGPDGALTVGLALAVGPAVRSRSHGSPQPIARSQSVRRSRPGHSRSKGEFSSCRGLPMLLNSGARNASHGGSARHVRVLQPL